MAIPRICMISRTAPDTDIIEQQLEGLEYQLDAQECRSSGQVIEAIKGADIIINQGVPLPREIIERIDQAQAIVSFGHGRNNGHPPRPYPSWVKQSQYLPAWSRQTSTSCARR